MKLLLILSLLVFSCTRKETAESSVKSELPIQASKQFPLIKLKPVEGASIPLENYRGKVLIINFWASWCDPCLEEIPALVNLYKDKKAKGLEIIGINVDSNPEKIIPRFRDRFGMTFPLYTDGDNSIIEGLGITGVPFNVIVDKKFLVRKINPGFEDWQNKDTVDFIDELLNEK